MHGRARSEGPRSGRVPVSKPPDFEVSLKLRVAAIGMPVSEKKLEEVIKSRCTELGEFLFPGLLASIDLCSVKPSVNWTYVRKEALEAAMRKVEIMRQAAERNMHSGDYSRFLREIGEKND